MNVCISYGNDAKTVTISVLTLKIVNMYEHHTKIYQNVWY